MPKEGADLIDPVLLEPIYSQGEAAAILGASSSTFSRWTQGYTTAAGTRKPPFVTTSGPGRGYTVPFIGLAEAWVVRAFNRAGVPIARIRPALDVLREEIGLDHALASDRLKTDGAEILWDLRSRDGEFEDDRLVVVRNHQAVFGEIVRAHLRFVDYRDGFAASLRVPRADGAGVTLDPLVNFGQPTLTAFGVRVADVEGRLRAGEAIEDVAADYGLPAETVTSLALAAA